MKNIFFRNITTGIGLILLSSVMSLTLSGEDSSHHINKMMIDNNQSQVRWKAIKSSGSSHDGIIKIKTGEVYVRDEDNSLVTGKIIIDMVSITCTDIEDESSNYSLVTHLKSNDFFNVDTFTTAELVISNTESIHDEKDSYLINGTLTIMDSTHPIQFKALIASLDSLSVKAAGVIPVDRVKYGIKYKSKTWHKDLGDHFIDDIFYISFNVVATHKK